MPPKKKDIVVTRQMPKSFTEIEYQKKLLQVEEQILLQEGLTSSDPETLIKAQARLQDVMNREKSDKKAILFDPYQVNDNMGYKTKGFMLSYNTLRRMAKTPIIRAVIGTRIEQVAAFLQPPVNKYSPGFKIRKKRSLFPDGKQEQIGNDQKRVIEYLTNFLINCGSLENSWHGDDFDSFTRKVIADSLVLDQMTFEVVRNRAGKPVEFLAVDGATMRIADTYDDDEFRVNEKEQINGYFPSYVQVIQERIVADFYPWEMCFGIRNQCTDIRNNGYGTSEIEDMINIITWMLYSDQYNGNIFKQGSFPKGILKVTGAGADKMAELRQQWQAMVAGFANAHKTLTINSETAEWIDMQPKNHDMEFSKWQEYLIKLSCAIYKIDPSEVGFPMQGAAGAQPMFESSQEAKLKYSKDKGLRPLLKAYEAKINKYIINPLNPNYEFVFVGIDSESEQAEIDLDIKKVGSFMGLKEIRVKNDLPAEIEEDDIILNPMYMQYRQMQMAGDQQSNQAVENMYQEDGSEGGGQQQPQEQETEKAEDSNPFVKDLSDFIETL